MTVSIHSSFLPHTDHEAAIGFYRDILGFEIRNDVGYNGLHWLTVGPPDQPDTSIVLYPPTADPGVTETEQAMIAEMMAKGTFARLLLAATDLAATFDSIVAAGGEIVQEPADQPYGVRDCAVRDPFGNLIRIQQSS
ncbi:MAG: VOC family protein [Corynebacteriales bacterium]|nr:VOC family protein [Mycobacteriales bacterium]